jgi:hypothetical protein
LNLGKNNISGEIPLFVGGEDVFRDRKWRLHSLPEFIRLLKSDAFGRRYYGGEVKDLEDIVKSNDMLWISSEAVNHFSELQEYVKAFNTGLSTEIFQPTLSDDPLSLIEKLKEHEQSKQNSFLTKELETMRRVPLSPIKQLKELQQTEQSAGRINDRNSILPTLMRSEKARRLIAIIGILLVVYDCLHQINDSKSY